MDLLEAHFHFQELRSCVEAIHSSETSKMKDTVLLFSEECFPNQLFLWYSSPLLEVVDDVTFVDGKRLGGGFSSVTSETHTPTQFCLITCELLSLLAEASMVNTFCVPRRLLYTSNIGINFWHTVDFRVDG